MSYTTGKVEKSITDPMLSTATQNPLRAIFLKATNLHPMKEQQSPANAERHLHHHFLPVFMLSTLML